MSVVRLERVGKRFASRFNREWQFPSHSVHGRLPGSNRNAPGYTKQPPGDVASAQSPLRASAGNAGAMQKRKARTLGESTLPPLRKTPRTL